jgi:hypothetical protein
MTKYVLLAVFPLLLSAQTVNTAATPEVTKVIHVRYVPAESIRDMVGHGSIAAFANNGLKAIVLKGSAASVAATEEAIKELDVPPPSESARDVELTVYVIGASTQSGQNGQPIAELEPVIRQLRAVFPYTGYHLLDSILIRTVEGQSARTTGLLRNFPNPQTGFLNQYEVNCDLDARSGDAKQGIRLKRFTFSTGVPNSEIRVSINTNLDLQDGQKVVVGKTNIDDGNSALFVVVTSKFVR